MPVKDDSKSILDRIRNFLKKLGPGLITGASDDDPSGIATYSQAGAQFGLSTLWTAAVSTPLMISIQEMCARIGIVTKKGLAGVIKENYSKPILYVIALITFIAVVFNIGADISAIGAVSNLLFPSISPKVFSTVFTVIFAITIIEFKYKRIASILKWLTLPFFAYFAVPFIVSQNWPQVIANTIIPSITWNKDFILILTAILGTTISPYLFFWQASEEVEEIKHRRVVVNRKLIKEVNFDVDIGMIFSNVVMFFIILTTGTVLFKAGINNINTVEQAATALRPLAGNASYLLFAIGIIGSGLLAIPVLAGSLSYMFAELRGKEESLDKKFKQAPGFYLTLILALGIGLLTNFLGISPVKMLIYTAVLYGLISPILIALILHICNSRQILGSYVNDAKSNILGILTFSAMTLTAIAFLYLQFFT